MTTRLRRRHILLTAGLALLLGACSGASTPAAIAAPGGAGAAASGAAAVSPPASIPAAAVPASAAGAGAAGKDITTFDPCSVVSDDDLVKAITDEASDPSALGTIKATHAVVDGTLTGLPGAKACKQTWTTTDSAGRESQGGDPVIVTFDLYSNLAEIQSGSPDNTADYASAGAVSFDAPGDAGDPHLTKNGYLFRMSGNSDSQLLKAIALGIASRL
jgi:hypothetical protein